MPEVTEQIVREAPEIEAYKLGLLKSAQALQAPTLPAYQVAGMSEPQLAALRAGQQGIGSFTPYLQAGTSALTRGTATLGEAADVLRGADTRQQFAAAQEALNRAAGSASNMGLGIASLAGAAGGYDPRMGMDFMNPYNQAVIQESLREINRQGDMARQNLQAQAVRAGAFGGSREGVQRAELERGLAQTRNQAILGALQQGYGAAQQQAQQAFEQQQQRQMAQGQNIASLFGQQSQIQQGLGQGIGALAGQQFGVGQAMSQGLGALGSQLGTMGVQQAALGQTAQGLGQQDVNFLFNLGSIQQRQQQAELDALRATRMQEALQPMQRLAFLSDIYKGAPSTQMGITQQAQAAPSPFQQIAGVGTGILGTAAAMNTASKLF